MEFSKRMNLFGDEIFAALNEKKVALEAQGRTIYNLSVGTPDFAPAPHIRQALVDAAKGPRELEVQPAGSARDAPGGLLLLQAAVRGGDYPRPGGQLQRQPGGLRPHRDGAVRRGGTPSFCPTPATPSSSPAPSWRGPSPTSIPW